MIKEKGTYEFKRWDGQVFTSGPDVEWLPIRFQFNHEITESNEEEYHHFIVSGHIWDIEINTGFRILKTFDSYKAADKFFQEITGRYPNSKILFREARATKIKMNN